jgi:hypothetical protein
MFSQTSAAHRTPRELLDSHSAAIDPRLFNIQVDHDDVHRRVPAGELQTAEQASTRNPIDITPKPKCPDWRGGTCEVAQRHALACACDARGDSIGPKQKSRHDSAPVEESPTRGAKLGVGSGVVGQAALWCADLNRLAVASCSGCREKSVNRFMARHAAAATEQSLEPHATNAPISPTPNRGNVRPARQLLRHVS